MSDLNELNKRDTDTGVSEDEFKKQQKAYNAISYESALDKMLKARDEVFKFPEPGSKQPVNAQCPKCQSVNIKLTDPKTQGYTCGLCNNKWIANPQTPTTGKKGKK
jgi:hypothetical protein